MVLSKLLGGAADEDGGGTETIGALSLLKLMLCDRAGIEVVP
jgi:hypothetical protein